MAITKAKSWTDVTVKYYGVEALHITSISHATSHNKQNNYGKGNLPLSRGRGKKEFTLAMQIDRLEADRLLEAVRAAAGPNADLTDIEPSDLIIEIDNGETFVVDVLKNFEFTETNYETNQGDMDYPVQCTCIVSNILYNQPI